MTISIIEKVKNGSDRCILWNWIKMVIYYKQRRNNEELIICLGKEIEPNALILRPKGKVLENGILRFFRRLSEESWYWKS